MPVRTLVAPAHKISLPTGPILFVLMIAALGATWQTSVTVLELPSYLVPSPGSTLTTLVARRGVILGQTLHTLGTAAAGLLCSSAFAILVAVLFTMSRNLTQATMPFVIALRTAPLVAVAPVITLVVGRGFISGVIIVIIASFFPVLVSCLRGFASVSATAYELLYVNGATRLQSLILLRFPTALPHLFAGLRVAAASALLASMLGEWLTGNKGLGLLILDSAEMRDVELLWSAIIVATVLSLGVFWLTGRIERSVIYWNRTE